MRCRYTWLEVDRTILSAAHGCLVVSAVSEISLTSYLSCFQGSPRTLPSWGSLSGEQEPHGYLLQQACHVSGCTNVPVTSENVTMAFRYRYGSPIHCSTACQEQNATFQSCQLEHFKTHCQLIPFCLKTLRHMCFSAKILGLCMVQTVAPLLPLTQLGENGTSDPAGPPIDLSQQEWQWQLLITGGILIRWLVSHFLRISERLLA